MSTIRVNWASANMDLMEYKIQRQSLAMQIAALRSAKSYRFMSGGKFSSIYRTLDRVIRSLDDEKRNMSKLEDGLRKVLREYNRYESDVEDRIHAEKLEEVVAAPVKPISYFVNWKNLWKTVTNIGVLGNVISIFGNLVTAEWKPGLGISIGKDAMKLFGNVAPALGKNPTASWKEALFGTTSALKNFQGMTPGQVFEGSLMKQFIQDLDFKHADSVGAKAKVATKWGGHILSLLGNGFENAEEFSGQEGMFLRATSETVIETAVDIGLGAVATAGVTAGASALLAAGVITAPVAAVVGSAAAVGVVATGAVIAANGICKWVTGGKDIGEVAADAVCDTAEAVGKGLQTVGKKATKALNAAAAWGKKLFSW